MSVDRKPVRISALISGNPNLAATMARATVTVVAPLAGSSGGAKINDASTSSTETWSAAKVKAFVEEKIAAALAGLTPAPADTSPNAFSFTDQNGVARSGNVESNAITIGGINAPAPISISGGEYQINAGAWTSANGTISNGQTVKVRLQSSASYSTVANATLTVAGVSDTFSVTTAAAPALPTLTVSGSLAYATDMVAGTVVATVANIPAGATLTISPADGRLAVANGNQIVIGLSPSTAGTIALTISAGGAQSTTATITVTAAATVDPDGPTGVLRFASPRNRVHNALAAPATATTVDYEVLIYADHRIGSGDMTELRARLDNFYIEQGTTKGPGNTITVKALYLESLTDAATVPVVFTDRPYPIVLADGEADLVSEAITPQMFASTKTVFARGEKYRYRGVISMPAGGNKYPAHWISGDDFAGGFAYYPNIRTPNNLASAGSITWDGASTGGSITMNGYSHFIPMLLGKFVSGDPLVYLGMGDSIFMGSGDGGDGNGTGAGLFSRFLFTPTPETTARAGCNASVNGGSGGTWTSGGNGGLNPRLATLVKYANRTVDNYGTNNFPTRTNYSGTEQAATQGAIYSPWPHLRSLASTAPGTKPMKIWRTKLMPRTGGNIVTPFPEDQTVWKGGAEISEQWEATGVPGELSSTDKFHDWLQVQLTNKAIDGLIDFDPLVRADPFGDRSMSVLYHRWAGGSFILSDGTHPGTGSPIIAAYLDDRIHALEGGTVRPKFNLIGSSRKLEGANGATTTYQFMVTRNTTSGTASVKWNVVGFSGTTVNANDFVGGVIPSGTVIIADGSAHATFDVIVLGDQTAEGNELFNVVLSDPSNGYGVYFSTARGQITNDDGDPPLWTPAELGDKLVDWFRPLDVTSPGVWNGAKGVLAYSQPDATKQPSFNATSYGATGAANFDGVDDVLMITQPTKLPVANEHFGLFAMSYNSNGNWGTFAYQGNNVDATSRQLGKSNGTTYGIPYIRHASYKPFGSSTGTRWYQGRYDFIMEVPSGPVGSWVNATWTAHGRTTVAHVANVEAANITPAIALLGGRINTDTGATSDPWGGSIGIHGYLRAPLTTEEQQRLQGYMSWATKDNGASLPSSHPYKTVAPVIEAP